MDAGRQSWLNRKALDIVVGIEVGVIGGVLMLALLMLAAPVLGQPWWTYPNLFASHYYSRPVVRYGPGLVTLSGAGLQVFWAAIVGAAAGFVAPRGRNGVLFAMLWFLGCYAFIWRKYAPGIGLYGSPAVLFVSFLLYGSVLRFQPKFRARLRTHLPPAPLPYQLPPPPAASLDETRSSDPVSGTNGDTRPPD